ncbi:MAG: radical SAM protein [Deltaproteobacteria bacterium]|nr:radical SAM protein [Armatimonadota bacterium]MBI3074360.1 radical SAM protein [Deltaproteobacteria bacterium]
MNPSARHDQLRVVFWETTAGCNLRCIHCRRIDVADTMMCDDLSTAECLDLVDQVREAGAGILVLSGGEPLIRPDIFEIARHGADAGLIMALATNGVLVTPELAARIRDNGIARVSVSLDGGNAETHDKFRALPGSFESALAGLRNLRDVGVATQINTTLARHNDGQLRAIYDLALSVGAIALHTFMLVPVGCGVQIAESGVLSATRYDEILNEIYDLSHEKKIEIRPTCSPHYQRVQRERARGEGRHVSVEVDGPIVMTKGCLAGQTICFVSHKGEVFPCGYLPVEAGNVRRQRLATIWHDSQLFATLRQPEGLDGKCGACEFRRVCMGCRARAYYDRGDVMGAEPFCAYEPDVGARHDSDPRLVPLGRTRGA